VGSDLHAQWVREAVEAVGLPVLGVFRARTHWAIPERHLGLYTAVERMTEVKAFLEDAAALVSQHIDLDRVWSIAFQAAPIEVVAAPAASFAAPHTRIGVARDELSASIMRITSTCCVLRVPRSFFQPAA
jgi:cobyrinic acid a,c-diamide synthase